MAAPVDADVRWAGRGVRADEVAAHMLALRQDAADEDGYPLARASVMNLLVYASAPEQIDLALRTVDELAVRHPSRAIVVGVRSGKGLSLDAEVTIRRHPLASHRLVYEQAVLRPEADNPSGVDTLVIPLLIPHLQSFLWWLGDPDPADPALRSLASIADRLVIDSSLGDAHRLVDLSEQLGPGTEGPTNRTFSRLVLGDLTWTRLDMFRQTLARVFDEHGRSEYLDGLTRVELVAARAARAGASAAEVLMAGWIASRLGCTSPVRSAGGVGLRLSPTDAPVAFDFTAVRGARPAGPRMPLRGVRLWAEHRRKSLFVDLEVRKEHAHVDVTETGAGQVSRMVAMSHLAEAEVLSRELGRLGRDRVFEDALVSAARIQAALTA